MAPQISTQLRERIVFWRYEQHKKAPKIAQLAGCAESTVYKVLWLYWDYGQITNPHGRHRGLSELCTYEALASVKTRLTLTDFLLHQVRSEVRSSGDVV